MTATSNQTYQIDLPVYSGPLDLLIHLIEQNELDITSISLLAVTDQYLAYIESLKESKLEELIDFIVIGARLLLIKSRALLPQTNTSLSLEEQEDPAEMLARQLRQYKQYKDAALWLSTRREEGYRTYLRLAPPLQIGSQIDLEGLTTASLTSALKEALNRTQLREDSVSIATRERQITIEGQIAMLQERLLTTSRTFFSDLLSENVNVQEISVTLLAVLELIKRLEITVWQPEVFGPIEIVLVQAPSSEQATTTSS